MTEDLDETSNRRDWEPLRSHVQGDVKPPCKKSSLYAAFAEDRVPKPPSIKRARYLTEDVFKENWSLIHCAIITLCSCHIQANGEAIFKESYKNSSHVSLSGGEFSF